MKMLKKLLNGGRDAMPEQDNVKTLATLDADDLRKFQSQRQTIADQARLLAMLQSCYTTFMANVQAKYNVPANISVNVKTGDLREVQPEQASV